jgi:hypothetical protein
MNEHDHNLILRLAFDSLPAKIADQWNDSFDAAYETCMWPDTYAVNLKRDETGVWRNYFPRTSRKPGKSQFESNLPDLEFYASKLMLSLKNGDFNEAGRFLGVFSHLLADFAQPAHWYEKESALLMPPPAELGHRHLHSMIESVESSLERLDATPAVFADSIEELLFKLSRKFQQLMESTVSAIVPMIAALYADDIEQATHVLNPVMEKAAAILADCVATFHAVAFDDFTNAERDTLRRCPLSEASPATFDMENVFGQRPLTGSFTLKPYCDSPTPFAMATDKGKLISDCVCAIPYAMPEGDRPMWSWMEYAIPAGLYNRFETFVGLCENAVPQASVRFEILSGEKVLSATGMMKAGEPAIFLSAEIANITHLKLIVHTDGSTDKLAFPLWGNAAFIK